MPTQCSQTEMDFGSSGGRKLVGAFDGGAITSNGGVVLLAAADKRIGLGARLAACFTDHRNPERIEHGLADILRCAAPDPRRRSRQRAGDCRYRTERSPVSAPRRKTDLNVSKHLKRCCTMTRSSVTVSRATP